MTFFDTLCQTNRTAGARKRVILKIFRATGQCAVWVNDMWDRSEELIDGRPVYFKKRGSGYYAITKLWIIISFLNRGTDKGKAFVSCIPTGALEECTGVWRTLNHGRWEKQPSVKVVRHN